MIRAPLSSSIRVSLGRLMIRRRLTLIAGVASPAIFRGRNRNWGGTKYRLVERGLYLRPGAGTAPSVPGCGGSGSEASRERVVAGEQPISDGDLTPSSYAELLPEDVAMRLCRPR